MHKRHSIVNVFRYDEYTVATVLKDFLRELPEPLFDFNEFLSIPGTFIVLARLRCICSYTIMSQKTKRKTRCDKA